MRKSDPHFVALLLGLAICILRFGFSQAVSVLLYSREGVSVQGQLCDDCFIVAIHKFKRQTCIVILFPTFAVGGFSHSFSAIDSAPLVPGHQREFASARDH